MCIFVGLIYLYLCMHDTMFFMEYCGYRISFRKIQNLNSAQIKIMLPECWKFVMIRTCDNGPNRKQNLMQFCRSTISLEDSLLSDKVYMIRNQNSQITYFFSSLQLSKVQSEKSFFFLFREYRSLTDLIN